MSPGVSKLRASSLAAFHLVGDRSGLSVEEAKSWSFRPALFANYRDLKRLRYDFPLVLGSGGEQDWVRSLADSTDFALQKSAAEGIEGEEARRQVLNLEQEIRHLVADRQSDLLSSLWKNASQALVNDPTLEGQTEKLAANLDKAYAQLDFDGEVIDCDTHLPVRLIRHAWKQSQQVKSTRLHKRIERLIHKLSDILQVEYLYSDEAHDAAHLESSLAVKDHNVFDFEVMAGILKSVPVGDPLPEKRQQRIIAAIKVLESQGFVTASAADTPFEFDFEDCNSALTTFRQRLPAMAELVKAISIAELEIENRYTESRHDDFYNDFDEDRLGAEDLALFPSYLVHVEQADTAANTQAMLELMRTGLPFKIIARTDNITGDLSTAAGQLSFGIQGQQLASMAMGLGNVFVLQSAASSLYQLRSSIMQGLSSDRPALYSVYSGAQGELPAYLVAAAATESRAFPIFVYDPADGMDLASHFHLDGNPHRENDWSRHSVRYEDGTHNSQTEETAFTLVDFMASDRRFASHFAPLAEDQWDSEMLPVAEFLEMEATSRAGKIPYVLLIDENSSLQRAVCDGKLIDAALRCRERWHSLQELGGINNSYALHALAEAQTAWEIEKQALLKQASTSPATKAAPVASPPELVAEIPETTAAIEPHTEESAEASSDDPWIETFRCTTCNECTELNDRMFAYDADKRAYIKDANAGTYRELVEAAEACQVAIIHPGKPRNPDESNLQELMERAESFND
ncbi:MAG: hypothetical protein GQ538_01795 [Xanthomonadales bacterium]|nr:hypothetical protein [Xanthomonadales bacterium]